MSIIKKTDYSSEATGTLIPAVPFGSATKLMSILAALMDQIQAIEDDAAAYAEQLDATDLSGVSGVHLDRLGALIGQPRWERSDADYRVLLACRMIANATSGVPEDIIAIAAALLGTTVTYTGGPASYHLTWYPTTYTADDTIAALRALLRAATPAGVAFSLVEETDKAATVDFRLDTTGAGQDLGVLTARIWNG